MIESLKYFNLLDIYLAGLIVVKHFCLKAIVKSNVAMNTDSVWTSSTIVHKIQQYTHCQLHLHSAQTVAG